MIAVLGDRQVVRRRPPDRPHDGRGAARRYARDSSAVFSRRASVWSMQQHHAREREQEVLDLGAAERRDSASACARGCRRPPARRAGPRSRRRSFRATAPQAPRPRRRRRSRRPRSCRGPTRPRPRRTIQSPSSNEASLVNAASASRSSRSRSENSANRAIPSTRSGSAPTASLSSPCLDGGDRDGVHDVGHGAAAAQIVHGLASPWSTGPIATAFADRWTAL